MNIFYVTDVVQWNVPAAVPRTIDIDQPYAVSEVDGSRIRVKFNGRNLPGWFTASNFALVERTVVLRTFWIVTYKRREDNRPFHELPFSPEIIEESATRFCRNLVRDGYVIVSKNKITIEMKG